jgi:uncharacterized protein (DUF1778 family)
LFEKTLKFSYKTRKKRGGVLFKRAKTGYFDEFFTKNAVGWLTLESPTISEKTNLCGSCVQARKSRCIYIVMTKDYNLTIKSNYIMQSTTTAPRATPLNIRIRTDQRSLIEQAALALDKTVSDFVREAALREASSALLDQTVFQLDGAAWDKFNVALDASPSNNPKLKDLLSRKPIWEE